jgi:hypothetical protein
VTNQTICRLDGSADEHQIIIECNSENWDAEATDAPARFHAALARYGIASDGVVDCAHRRFNNALAIPTPAHIAPFNSLRDTFMRRFPFVRLMGPARSCVSATLNDHLIQALQIAHSEGALS